MRKITQHQTVVKFFLDDNLVQGIIGKYVLAEVVGFEPTCRFQRSDFKSVPIGHSGTLPYSLVDLGRIELHSQSTCKADRQPHYLSPYVYDPGSSSRAAAKRSIGRYSPGRFAGISPHAFACPSWDGARQYVYIHWCARLDSNQHAFRHQHLKLAFLPI